MSKKLLTLAALLALSACAYVKPYEEGRIAVQQIPDSERCINKPMEERPDCYARAYGFTPKHEVTS